VTDPLGEETNPPGTSPAVTDPLGEETNPPETSPAVTNPSVGPERVGCVVVAAGDGRRLGASRPKAFVDLAGRPLLRHAVDRVLASGVVGEVVAVVGVGWLDEARRVLPAGCRVVAGGVDRQASVAVGLRSLPDRTDVVLVHDAARCLAPSGLFGRVVAAVRAGHRAVVPGLPVTDTVKVVDRDGSVVGTVDREPLRAVQTPQGFARDLLARAHADAARAGGAVTDDAGLVERLGQPVLVVPGHWLARKITTAADLRLAGYLVSVGEDSCGEDSCGEDS
jgi:2-C-methyl-D-erythritol 4-phosphate cytidylyltransferase